jgi:surface antigen
VVDSRDVPSRDGLDDLFGDSSFNDILGVSPAAPAAPVAPVAHGHLPSRRELRGAAPKSKAKATPKAKAVARTKAPKPRKRKAEPAAPPPAFVKPHDSAYPTTRVIVVRRGPAPAKRQRAKGFFTILAVIGLFGTVALPAYAFAPRADADNTGTTATPAPADAALSVPATASVTAADRGTFRATSADELRYQKRTSLVAANYAAYMASGAREKGDDYPWFSELSNNQGGGLSPLNYFYRECVDFVAWRLNRDAGYTSAPYLYTWSTLTPTGGNAYQWKYAWTHKGWPTSTTPIAGSVAWYSYNHVAYVKSVNADGTITIEDYNQSGMHVYDQRVVAPNDAQLYLYPPPR